MSVSIIDREDIIKAAENAQPAPIQTLKNFYDVFGTTGCLLNCEEERTMEQNFRYNETGYHGSKKRGERIARCKHLKQSRGSRQEWFNASEITQSAKQGCGSCSVLSQIIQNVFSGCKELSSAYEYSVHYDFKLRRRLSSLEGEMEVVQLFQPPGM
jgi:hypothetical protein